MLLDDFYDFTLLIDRTMIDTCNIKYLNIIIRVFFSKIEREYREDPVMPFLK